MTLGCPVTYGVTLYHGNPSSGYVSYTLIPILGFTETSGGEHGSNLGSGNPNHNQVNLGRLMSHLCTPWYLWKNTSYSISMVSYSLFQHQ